MRAKSRIDRRFAPVDETVPLAAMPARVIFNDAWGNVEQTFDIAELAGVPADLAAILLRAFHVHDLAGARKTRTARWHALKEIAEFLRDRRDVETARDLDDALLRRFAGWMAERHDRARGPQSLAGQVSLLRPLIERAAHDDPDVFGGPRTIPAYLFPNSHKHRQPKRRLSSQDMKAILAACYREIDEAWETFQYGQAIAALPEPPPLIPRGIGKDRLIWLHHRAGRGIAPTVEQMRAHGLGKDTLLLYGRQRGFARHYHLITDTLVPFYIALAIQTAANPDPLRLIRRDCLVPHPLDEERMFIEWLKPKTGGRIKRMQRRSFDRRRSRSAPRLVEMLLKMTAPLLPHVGEQDRDRLFLIRRMGSSRARGHRHLAGVIRWETLALAICRFIVRSNERIEAWNAAHPERPRRLLPDFSAGLFRGSVATAHYEASEGDILAPKAVLNHVSVATTSAYIEGAAAQRIERETIARLQELMLAWVIPRPVAPSGAGERQTASVLFGNDCLAPVSGAGGLCPKLGGCLACPGLVVPLDAEHLARILQARAHLEEARDRIDPQRWALFYASSLRALTHDLLPDFPDELLPKARRIAATLPPLPDLE
ncbi:hypothetical protein RFM41_33795 [Mesorhizobium sp. VK25A]|uniref:Site-specific integrase n=1 Tax=Mesorhizobium vachelliae TaxID=3072309 RepID=A0ABU5AF88_9HYPH|nr:MULTISPECIES: hypothetical protein [unclassified Mesorhizobium]MDX8535942.1 hypothetical protein [Mesorhizobium sp. VK25D]MDX8548696.1 hypothetical protein [Mesorhizobium sp. VK25A]